MRNARGSVWAAAATALGLVTAAQVPQAASVTELRRFALDDLEGVLTRSGVELDTATSSDGKASLRVTATEPRTVRLFEVTGLEIDNARLIYEARVRTEGVQGQVFLEMWCHFPGQGEFFSRGLDTPMSGTTEWSSLETPFFLRAGEKPDLVKLNLVVEGTGTVWIDDVRLTRRPLQ